MKPVRIKICGLTRQEDIEAVNRARPEYCGFVFWKGSKRRYIEPSKAALLIRELAPEIRPVGVFLDEPISSLIESCLISGVDMVQLHGSEDETYIAEVRKRLGKPVIKAFKITSAEDIRLARESAADYIMLDSGAGTGRTFSWDLIGELGREYFLAGGLDPDNVELALKELEPYCLDVSSGVETDGVKDPDKIQRFIDKVRRG